MTQREGSNEREDGRDPAQPAICTCRAMADKDSPLEVQVAPEQCGRMAPGSILAVSTLAPSGHPLPFQSQLARMLPL